MKAKFLISSLSALAFFTSCGKGSSGGGSNFVPQIYTQTPIFLEKEYKVCPRIYAQSTNTELEVIRFLKGNSITKRINFVEILDGDKLVDKENIIFTQTIGDYTYTEMFKDIWSETAQEYETESVDIETAGTQFKICKGAQKFSKNSLENAALNITNTIKETRASILLASPGMKIPAVLVHILPLKKREQVFINGPLAKGETENENGDKVYVASETYATDNATWSGNGDVDTITFLPQSKEFIKISKIKTPLWEMPMVGAHEFGHHIFDKIFPFKFYNGSVRKKSFGSCLHNVMAHKISRAHYAKKIADDEQRHSGAVYAYYSLHEGIGDLISYYGLKNNEANLTGVNCMAQSRDANSAVFGNGRSKIFDVDAVRIMNSNEYITASKDCNAPNYQDSHAIGAIFAYNFESIVSNFTSDRILKLETLLRWGKEASKYQGDFKELTPSKYMAEVTKILYSTLYQKFGVQNRTRDCSKIKSLFYELKEDFGSREHMNCK